MLTNGSDSHQSNGSSGSATLKKRPPPVHHTDRRPPVDPLMVAAAAAAGPDITRNHYLHEFFPHSQAYATCDDDSNALDARRTASSSSSSSSQRPQLVSQQQPRRQRLAAEAAEARAREEQHSTSNGIVPVTLHDMPSPPPKAAAHQSPSPKPAESSSSPHSAASAASRRLSTSDPATMKLLRHQNAPASTPTSSAAVGAGSTAVNAPLPPLQVRCEVRTRIPTPHGHIFLHLYSNNHDQKEHLAFVADQAQMDSSDVTDLRGPDETRPFIRSRSLDKEWREGESEMERVVRGAYVGRLSANSIHAVASTSKAAQTQQPAVDGASTAATSTSAEAPLVRIHSECFTGETIGSQRCDCGEQLDEAFRLITQAQRGVVVYLRQEGRGIGLLEKMRAYNLQDLGHDTVTANLMLGHGADMRTYDIAGAILRDLSVDEVRLLTNNPDKIEQIEKEGVKVVERVAMVPRAWVPVSKPLTARRSHHRRHHGEGGARAGKSGSGSTSGHPRRRRPRMSGAALLQAALAAQHPPPSPMLSSGVQSEVEHDDEESSSYGTGSLSDHDHNRDHKGDALSSDYYSSSGLSSSDDYDDDDDDEDDNESLMLRRSGVGMIGAGTTRSAELEKYLRTKIERMGHMLDAPPPLPASGTGTGTGTSTPADSERERERERKSGSRRKLTKTKSGKSTGSASRSQAGSGTATPDRVTSSAATPSTTTTLGPAPMSMPIPPSGATRPAPKPHPLASSVLSLDMAIKTDEDSVNCGSGCEQCGTGEAPTTEEDDEEAGMGEV